MESSINSQLIFQHHNLARNTEAWPSHLRRSVNYASDYCVAGLRIVDISGNPSLNDQAVSTLCEALKDDAWIEGIVTVFLLLEYQE